MGLIYLCGLPGLGKTTIGKLLAESLGVEFIDLDKVIEHSAGESISGLFESEGESHFRGLERKELKNCVNLKSGVIALGGGIFETESNLDFVLNSGTLVYLDAAPEVIVSRNHNWKSRPLFNEVPHGEEVQKLVELHRRRRNRYERAHHKVTILAQMTPQDVVHEIMRRING